MPDPTKPESQILPAAAPRPLCVPWVVFKPISLSLPQITRTIEDQRCGKQKASLLDLEHAHLYSSPNPFSGRRQSACKSPEPNSSRQKEVHLFHLLWVCRTHCPSDSSVHSLFLTHLPLFRSPSLPSPGKPQRIWGFRALYKLGVG